MGNGTIRDIGQPEIRARTCGVVRERTVWYHDGSAYGMREPNSSNASAGSSSAFATGAAAAAGFLTTGAGGGGGGAACFFESRDPTLSFGWYFLRMPSVTDQPLRKQRLSR